MKQFVLPETFSSGFSIGLLAKDADIAAQLNRDLGCRSMHIDLTNQRWAETRDALGAGADHSKAIVAWAKTKS